MSYAQQGYPFEMRPFSCAVTSMRFEAASVSGKAMARKCGYGHEDNDGMIQTLM